MRYFIKTVLAFALAMPAYAITPVDMDSGLSAADLARTLIGANQVSIDNVQYTGAASAAGTFTGGIADGLEIENGVILSTGRIADATGPNSSTNKTTIHGSSGDADLDAVAGSATRDAAVLEFDFTPAGGTLSFQYIFASEEYNEFVNAGFNDVFGFFLDGVNIALVPNTSTVVSINTINRNVNSAFFKDNDFDVGTPFGTEFDGFTAVLEARANITPGVAHHIKLAIADVSDSRFDSAVFIREGSFETVTPAAAEIEVLDETAPILDGTSAAIDFGTSTVGSPVTRTFTINNTGTAVLNLSNPSVPAGFSLSGFPADVAAGSAASFQIQLSATAAGNFAGTFSFTTNDSDENPFDFPIRGTIIAEAEIEVSDGSAPILDGTSVAIDFGASTVGTPATRTITINNTGTAVLNLSNPSFPAGFSLSGFPANVAAGSVASFQIQLDATTAGNFVGTFSFTTNDSNENPFDFSISGTVNAVVAPVSVTKDIPTLSEWAMILLSCLLLLFGMARSRRAKQS